MGNPLTGWGTISFSRRTLLCGVRLAFSVFSMYFLFHFFLIRSVCLRPFFLLIFFWSFFYVPQYFFVYITTVLLLIFLSNWFLSILNLFCLPSVILCVSYTRAVNRCSSVGIVTRYGLDGPGIESRWGRDFSQLSRPALGPTQPR
jgi:hypothetical protein